MLMKHNQGEKCTGILLDKELFFNILTSLFKCLHSGSTVHLCELMLSYNASRLLRSSRGNVSFDVLKLSERGFLVSGTTHSLPEHITQHQVSKTPQNPYIQCYNSYLINTV